LAEQVRKQAEPERWSINAVIRLAIETRFAETGRMG
jgi:hypothetical protein